VTQETHHYNSTWSSYSVGTTTKWYDGSDRLVEVQLPSDQNVDNDNPNKTRYIYDLTQAAAAATSPLEP
jgi:hypothetical protein